MSRNVGNITVYTDGSCHPQAKLGAWAAIILVEDKTIELCGFQERTTHNRMELAAVIAALEYIDEVFPNPGIIDVHSDSQYVCGLPARRSRIQGNDLLNRVGKPLPNSDLLARLFRCLERHPVQFTKVKAHQKHRDGDDNWNRRVDKLARKTMRRALKRKRMLRD